MHFDAMGKQAGYVAVVFYARPGTTSKFLKAAMGSNKETDHVQLRPPS